jgi:hypothetical protein
MKKTYVKETLIQDKSSEEKRLELIKNIVDTKKKLFEANENYEYADGKLIDYFLYTMKAEQAKLEYLLGKAKLQGLSIDIKEIEKKML